MFESVPTVLEALKQGKTVILLDERREHEGDLMCIAEFVTPQIINFMITHCRGIVCLTLDQMIAKKLRLSLHDRRNIAPDDTAFTISIDAKDGITSGTSAYDRAHTIKVAVDQNSTEESIRTPGHIFPIIAHQEGFKARQGHTEASVLLAKLAGCQHAAVLCEIMHEDGTMAKTNDIMNFALKHQLKVLKVDALLEYA